MKLRFLVISMILTKSLFVFGQTKPCSFFLSGNVLDEDTGEPVPFAVVKVDGVNKFASTDVNGNFKIDGLCNEENTLIISCIGYFESKKDQSTIGHQHDSEIHFYLTKKVTGLEEVTIRAARAKEKGTETISQVSLGRSEITNNPTQSLAAALSQQNGVTFTSNGTNVQLPVIHGLYGNRILILNNGLKHGFQNWGSDHAPEINLASANRITVLKGAAGVRYGPEALGGAIVIEPNPLLLENPFYAKLGAGFQSNGRGYHTNFEMGKGSKHWSYFVDGNFTKIGDRHAPDYSLTNSGKMEKAFGAGILHHHKHFDFKLYYSFIDQDLALLRSSIANSPDIFIKAINSERPYFIRSFSYDINQPYQKTQHHLAKAEANWWYSNEAKLSLIGSVQLNKRDEYDVRRNRQLPIIDLDLLTFDYQLVWNHPDWKGFDGLVGLQFFNQNSDNNPGTHTTPFIPNYNTNRYSAFIIESIVIGSNTLEAGFRLDHETNNARGREVNQDSFRDNYSFTNLTASLGYVRQISDKTSFRTNFGTAWRTPNMAELFSFGQHGFKTTYGLLRYSNNEDKIQTNKVSLLEESDVSPEKGYKFINEFKIAKNSYSHTITAYSNYIENYIFDRPIGVFGTFRGPMPAYIFDQANALFFGVDYTLKKEWIKKITGIFGLSYLWSKNVDKNEPLINQPPVSTNVELQWDHGKLWGLQRSKWTISSSYTFRQFQAPRTITPQSLVNGTYSLHTDSEIFDFINAPKGYFILDLSWSFQWKNIKGNIAAKNLLNTSYRDYLNEMRYFADEPGRNILLTINYSFKSKRK